MTDAATRLAERRGTPSQVFQHSESPPHPVEQCVTIEDGPRRWLYRYWTREGGLFEFTITRNGRAHSTDIIDRVPEPGSKPN